MTKSYAEEVREAEASLTASIEAQGERARRERMADERPVPLWQALLGCLPVSLFLLAIGWHGCRSHGAPAPAARASAARPSTAGAWILTRADEPAMLLEIAPGGRRRLHREGRLYEGTWRVTADLEGERRPDRLRVQAMHEGEDGATCWSSELALVPGRLAPPEAGWKLTRAE